jgi:hypothetical protein
MYVGWELDRQANALRCVFENWKYSGRIVRCRRLLRLRRPPLVQDAYLFWLITAATRTCNLRELVIGSG